MSLCVGIIKTVGVTSLGLYTGILASAYIVSKTDDTSLTSKKILCKLSKMATVFLKISTLFLGVGYFKVPLIYKQPYTFYGFCVGPATFAYCLLTNGFIDCCAIKTAFKYPLTFAHGLFKRFAVNCCVKKTEGVCPASGSTEGVCPASTKASEEKNISCKKIPVGLSINIAALIVTTLPVFTINILGLYGEGVL
ncbi:hypothetical protein QEN19_000500 [Hanseniaspora menglaensis]